MADEQNFSWVPFYEAVAQALLAYRDKDVRKGLVAKIKQFADDNNLNYLNYEKNIEDICPFTLMGVFNRGIGDQKRIELASKIANILNISAGGVENFNFSGVPVLINLKSVFCKSDDIPTLWEMFVTADGLAKNDTPENREIFIQKYDEARKVKGVKWNLSMGLYWMHPNYFIALDERARDYLSKKYGFAMSGSTGLDGESYLVLRDSVVAKLNSAKEGEPKTIPEMSYQAWMDDKESSTPQGESGGMGADNDERDEFVAEIMSDGCFFPRDDIGEIYDIFNEDSYNLILQGPPGTGKTWLAKRLAYAWMGEKKEKNIRHVQFHPNMSYEDFVRGWRPDGKGNLAIADGVLLEIIGKACEDTENPYFLIIEEINRGNPAQIFGEFLTLIESSKRGEDHAMELVYPDPEDYPQQGKAESGRTPIWVPDNLYIIGTMNTADRSLALMDFAFRRRFTFKTLQAQVNKQWMDYMHGCRIDKSALEEIKKRMGKLSNMICDDKNLGHHYQIGHSFVTVDADEIAEDKHISWDYDETMAWFDRRLRHAILPLLEEYWHDNPDAFNEAKKILQGKMAKDDGDGDSINDVAGGSTDNASNNNPANAEG